MKDWESIRVNRRDLTDYVTHFTKHKWLSFPDGGPQFFTARDVLLEILRAGFIRAAFAPLPNRSSSVPRATVKGPWPAVCLTEQPLWAVLKTKSAVWKSRYSGYGIAYHKSLLFGLGGRPVIYGAYDILGKRIQPGEPNYEENKDIFRDGLPPHLQWLWVNYQPAVPMSGSRNFPVDFTWEREWRIRPPSQLGLPVAIGHYWPDPCGGAIIVEQDDDVAIIRQEMQTHAAAGKDWPKFVTRIVSLQAVERQLAEGNDVYGRLETVPEG